MRKIKWFIQKIFQGYSDCEIWGLNYTLAKWLLPRLKALRQNKHSYPSDMGGIKQWHGVLKKIIWAMDFIVKDEDFELYPYGYVECYTRCDEGCELLGKYFRDLWD